MENSAYGGASSVFLDQPFYYCVYIHINCFCRCLYVQNVKTLITACFLSLRNLGLPRKRYICITLQSCNTGTLLNTTTERCDAVYNESCMTAAIRCRVNIYSELLISHIQLINLSKHKQLMINSSFITLYAQSAIICQLYPPSALGHGLI